MTLSFGVSQIDPGSTTSNQGGFRKGAAPRLGRRSTSLMLNLPHEPQTGPTTPVDHPNPSPGGGDGGAAARSGMDPGGGAFTSQAAVMAYAGLIARRDSRVFAIGSATAHAAREAGFTAVDTPTDDEWGDVAALAERIARASPRPAMVMNPTAREPAADLAEMLVRRGVGARSVAVYETIKATLTAPPDNLFGILVHSPKAARAVAGLVDRDLAQRLCVWSISEAAAAPLRRLGFGRIVLADRPNEQALLEKLRQ